MQKQKSTRLEINKIVHELKANRKVETIILFGSYAKGKTKPLSDIDIAVIAKEPDKATEADVASLSSNVFDVVNFHRLPLYIQFEVLKYGKVLFVRHKNYFVQICAQLLHDYLEMSYWYEKRARAVLS